MPKKSMPKMSPKKKKGGKKPMPFDFAAMNAMRAAKPMGGAGKKKAMGGAGKKKC